MNKEIKYVPILKWKAAEQTALKHVLETDKEAIIPLAEIVLPGVVQYRKNKDGEKERKTDDEIHSEMVDKLKTTKMFKIPDEFVKSWGESQIYVDVTFIHNKEETNNLKVMVMSTLVRLSKKKGVQVIPVVNISDNPLIIAGVKKLAEEEVIDEICLRVSVPNLKKSDELDNKIESLISTVGIPLEKIHLLIDLKYIGDPFINYKELFDGAQKIKNLGVFKNFIFASGSFPVDMTEFLFEDSPSKISRLDWLNWKKYSESEGIVRVPIFSDYSIRYPLHDDSLQFFESTSTIKYTLEDDWIIVKGKKRALDLYLAHAYLFVQLPEFEQATFGEKEGFSYGDKCIVEKAEHFKPYIIAKKEGRDIKGTGTAPLWISYGMSHHTALVMRQLSSLDD